MESNVGRGRRGERLAAAYLERGGWTVLDRNWRDGPRELDLVAMREGVLAFIEVKARTGNSFGSPLEAIRARKRREVERAARAWLRSRAPAFPGIRMIRFDAVAVRFRTRDEPEFKHLEGAWRVGE